MKKPWLPFAAAALAAAPLHAKTYEIDADHTTVTFTVKHLGISKVSGHFDAFSGGFDYEPGKPKAWKVSADIDAASINTRLAPRDKHLRSADFFDVEKCPKLTFRSTRAGAVKGGKAKLTGDLTMHCVTKPVTLDLEIGDEVVDPWGNHKIGMSASARVDRREFGLTWNKPVEKQSGLKKIQDVAVGDWVDISIEVEAAEKTEKKEAPAAGKSSAGGGL